MQPRHASLGQALSLLLLVATLDIARADFLDEADRSFRSVPSIIRFGFGSVGPWTSKDTTSTARRPASFLLPATPFLIRVSSIFIDAQ